MSSPYPAIAPYEHGTLDVGDGNLLYWEQCGNPHGKPALVLHGGPGAGCTQWHRTLFDPQAYRVILLDQRNCGRSRPHASVPGVDLRANTTQHLVADTEHLRELLRVEEWLVLGGSWGSTLALAYAERHPGRITEVVLFGVTTGRHSEFDWLFRGGLSLFFPEQWQRLRAGLPEPVTDTDVPAAYHRLLIDPDPAVRQKAADNWCLWESATPAWPPTNGLAPRFRDPHYALAFARIVTHYVMHNAWLEDGALIAGVDVLSGVPAVLINGRYDFQSPIANAWTLKDAWRSAGLVIVDDAGHAADAPGMTRAIVQATDAFRAAR